jgi:hypothetical protein
LYNAIAVVSAVLCVMTAYFWRRSYFHWDSVDWSRGWTCWRLRSTDGTLGIQFNRHDPDKSQPSYYFDASSCPPFEPYDWSKSRDVIGVVTWEMMWRDRYWWWPETLFQFGGVSFERSATANLIGPPHPGCWAVDVRYPVLIVVMAAPPALSLLRVLWKRRRRNSGLCAECGYDLRATPERCPECGVIPPSRA